MKMRILSASLVAVLVLVLAGCGKDEPANTPAPAAAPPASAPAAAPTPPPAPATPAPSAPVAAAPAGGDVGIAECDEYLTKYEACLTDKVPAEAKATLQQSLDATRAAWRQAAGNAQSAEALRSACVQARESTRTSLQAYGCTDF